MKNDLYKQSVYLLAFTLMLFAASVSAQDTTVLKQLEAVDVSTTKVVLSGSGKKTDSLNSNVKQQFIYNSVGDALSLNSTVFIKNYGPGAIASTSFRGGNASQSAILWNGFNIQNSMLGQVDLSLLPMFLFENVSIEYGGSSSLWGTGAVAGSIQLLNSPVFNKGLTTRVNLSAGSFGLFNTSAGVQYSKEKFYSSTKAYLQNSNNNFTFKDTLNKEHPLQEQRHASYSFKGILQEFKFILNSKQTFGINTWYNLGYRQIPSFSTTRSVPATQIDDDLRLTANWNYNARKFNSTIKGAFFNDKINYTDSLLSVYSKSRVQNSIIENENIVQWGNCNLFNIGVNFSAAKAISNNYDGSKNLSKIAFLAGNKFYFFGQLLSIYPVVRAEYFSVGTLPVTGNISMEYAILKSLKAKVNTAKVYRQPTFNELYWQPGGNINLLPEQGYTYEGDIEFSKKIKRVSFGISGSAYYRVIDNWILWLPGANGSPSPINIQKVWSRGTETKWNIDWTKNNFRIKANVLTAYCLSTVKSSVEENGNTTDKQLIYTPRYLANANLTLAYDFISLTWYQQYVGYRFTSSDNLQWLHPYHYSSVRLNINTEIKEETKAVIFIACNNVTNTNYSVVAGRYMPLRSYEFGISLLTNKIKTKKEEQPQIIEINNQ